jgi:ATP-binding cassette subfamily B protein
MHIEDNLERKTAITMHLIRLVKPYWLHLTGIFLLSLIAAPLSLMLAFPLKIVVDNVIGNRALPHILQALLPAWAMRTQNAHLFLAAALFLTLSLTLNLQAFASWLLQTYTGEKLVLDLRSELFWHVQRMNLLFHDRVGPNEAAYRIQHDAPAIQYIFMQAAVPMMTAALTFAGMLYVTIRLDWVLAAIALSLSPVLFAVARKASHKARAGWDGTKKLDSSAMLVLYESLSFIRVVKAFGQEMFQHNRFRLRSRQRMAAQVQAASTQAAFHVITGTTLALGSTLALLIGVRHVKAGMITLGDLLLVMAYMAQLCEPLGTVSNKLPELQSWIVSMRRALVLLEGVPELEEEQPGVPIQRVAGDVSFHDVSFEYPSSGRVLTGVSFDVPAGAKVGVVGPSGSGKTTLVNLLTRFYDPCAGRILLDGHDLRSLRLGDLRRQFSVVLQDPVVFSATIAENISYARPDASRHEVIQVAKAAGAHEFIMALPDGYDTQIGEGGCGLSGGQRQRLAIARAFLRDAPILILDEPTSSIDISTEREIMEATGELLRGRTTFVIAHRPDTVKDCDLLLVLQHGRIQVIGSNVGTAMQASANHQHLAAVRSHQAAAVTK